MRTQTPHFGLSTKLGLLVIAFVLVATAVWRADASLSKPIAVWPAHVYTVGANFFFDTTLLHPETAMLTSDVRMQLRAKGVSFPPGTSASYTPSSQKLVIVNDPDQNELIGELVMASVSPNIQTKVGTRFVEIPQH